MLIASCTTWQSGNAYHVGDVFQYGTTCYQAINSVSEYVIPGTDPWFYKVVDCATFCSVQIDTVQIDTTVLGRTKEHDHDMFLLYLGLACGTLLAVGFDNGSRR